MALVGVTGIALLALDGGRDDTYVAQPARGGSATAPDGPRTDRAADALRALVRAVRGGHEATARALAPVDDAAAAARLAGVVATARQARVRDFSARLVAPEGAPAGGAWSAVAEVTWRFAGLDRRPASAEVRVGLRDEAGRVAITRIGGRGHVAPLWLSGRLAVRRGADTLVLVAPGAGPVQPYAERARAAVRAVRRVLPAWHAGLVVEVPASQRALERTLGVPAGTEEQIAAVTTAPDGSTTARAPVHVFVNPDLFGRLRPAGAAVVMSHEATHVATGAYASPLPLWLLEGFADYVALRGVRLPVARSAAQAVARVDRRGLPARLPTDAAFGAQAEDLGATYEAAWLAVREVADEAGEAALVRFYRRADAGTPVARALASTTGLTVPGLTERWRDELRRLAQRGGAG